MAILDYSTIAIPTITRCGS